MQWNNCWLVFRISVRQWKHAVQRTVARTPAVILLPAALLLTVGFVQYRLVQYFGNLARQPYANDAAYRLLAVEQLVGIVSLTAVVLFGAWQEQRSRFLRGLPLEYGEAALGWYALPAIIAAMSEVVLSVPILIAVGDGWLNVTASVMWFLPLGLLSALIAFMISHGAIAIRSRYFPCGSRIADIAIALVGLSLVGTLTAASFSSSAVRAASPLYWVATIATSATPVALTLGCLVTLSWLAVVVTGMVMSLDGVTPTAELKEEPRFRWAFPGSMFLAFASLETRLVLRDNQSMLSSLYIGGMVIGEVAFFRWIDIPREQVMPILAPIVALLIAYLPLTAVGRDRRAASYLAVLPVEWTRFQAAKAAVTAVQALSITTLVVAAGAAFGYLSSSSEVLMFYLTIGLYASVAFLFGTLWPVTPNMFSVDDLPAFAMFSLAAYALTAGSQQLIDFAPWGWSSSNAAAMVLLALEIVGCSTFAVLLRKESVR